MPEKRTRTRRGGPVEDSVRLEGLEADTLRRLIEQPTPVPLEELAGYLVGSATDASDTERLQVQLHHVTLPKLASAELLVYDADERIVEPPEA